MRIQCCWRRVLALIALPIALITGLVEAARSPADTKPAVLSDREAASHALNRLAFGGRPGQFDSVLKAGWKHWAEEQLHPEAIDDSSLSKQLAERCPSLSMSLAKIYETYQLPRQKADSPEEQRKLIMERNRLRNQLKQELIDSVILRAVYSERQFQEVIVEFWRNHLNVDVNKVPYLANHYEENVLRKFAFGKFEDLLMASAKHPAMLTYLDNFVSTSRGLNENYARELLELHTLGVDNVYTQGDVIELARVLTGWTCGARPKGKAAGPEYGFFFNERNHAAVPATVVGLKLDGKGGIADGEKAIRYLAHHEGTAHFICFKLCRYLVADHPPKELVDRAAGVFLKSGGDLREVYRAIIFAPEFTERANFRAKFKTPFEYTVSVLKATGAVVEKTQAIARDLQMMGQPIYECSVPTGYYDQAEAWLDPGILVYRWNFANQVAQGRYPGVTMPKSLFEPLQALKPPDKARRLVETLLPCCTNSKSIELFARESDPRTMVALILGSPEFQQQ